MTILDPPPTAEQSNPNKDFLKGLLYALVYYASGMALAALAYAIVGHPYIHAPGLHHWIVFLIFLGGFIWTLAAAVNYLVGTRTGKLRGIIVTNTLAVVSFVLVVYTILHEEHDTVAEAPDEISMSQNGDTTILYHNDNIIYMKVQDSVLLNFIDSARLQDIVDSTGGGDR